MMSPLLMVETEPSSKVLEVSNTLVVLLEAVTEEAITKSPLVPLLFPPPGTSVSVQDVNAVPAIAEVRSTADKRFFFILFCFIILH